MKIARLARTERIGSSAFGPVVAVVVLMATSAMAAPAAKAQHCGSYVVRIGDAEMAEWLGLATVSVSVADSEAGSLPEAPARPIVPPCNGPGCSRAPAAPGSGPTSIEPPPSVEHWAIASRDEVDDLPSSSRRPRSEGPPRLDPPTGDVFHPPRTR